MLRTFTDHSGSFTLKAGVPDTLRISYIGYETKEVAILKDEFLIAINRGGIDLQNLTISQNSSNHFSTISKIDLNLRPVKSSQDILKIVPGLFIAQHAGGGKPEQIFLRGFDIDHGTDIKISVDGLPVNMVSHAHGQGYADMHFIIPELVSSVDYGKGPYYTEQGNLNTAGYVHLKTLNALEKSRIQIEGGQFNTFRGLALVDLLPKNSKTQNAYIGTEYLYFDGPFKSPQKFKRFNTQVKYNQKINDQNSLSLLVTAFDSKWNASGQIPERAVKDGSIDRFGAIDDTEGGYTSRYNASLSHFYKMTNGNSFEQQLFYSKYDFRLFSNFTFFLNDSLHGDQIRQTDNRNVFGYHSKYMKTVEKKETVFKTLIGFELRFDQTKNTELSHTKNRTEVLEQIKLGDIKELNTSFYLDEKIRFQKVLIEMGARIDHFYFSYNDHLLAQQKQDQNKIIISPKINALYNLTENFQLYLKLGKGFHSNDTRVIVSNQGRQILPAAYGADLGLMFKPIKKLLLNTAIWYLYSQQEFVYLGDEGLTEPSGKSRRIGFDLSARYQITSHLFADANLNIADPRFVEEPENANFIPLAPRFTSSGGIHYQTKEGLNGGLKYKIIKRRPANENKSVLAKGYTIIDAALNYTRKRYEIGIAIENLLNKEWNEAQFDTDSRLKNEQAPVSELHFTPGTPFYGKLKIAFFF
jgi:outer membrane receptor protein involved in Fe transport